MYSESSDEDIDISNKETVPKIKSPRGDDEYDASKLGRSAPLSTTNEQEPNTADNTDNDDYDEEEEEDDDSSDSDAPKKVVLRIKPISEVDRSLAASPDVLRLVSKNLQLRFNKNENLKRRPLTAYAKSRQDNPAYSAEEHMLKSKLGNESLSSFTSSILNAQTVSPCASLSSPTPWQESRSASALGFFPATLEEAPRADLDLFSETSATMFIAPPPLPPLPITTQQKYQQRLNQLNALKSEPIKINQTLNKPDLFDNEFQMPAVDDVMKF